MHCTGVLAREAFDTFGLAPASVLNELTTVRFVAPSGETVEYSTPTVEAVVIDRCQFDRQLAAQARYAGVRMHLARVTALSVEPDGVTVLAAESTIRARACVLACGASYRLQRRLGLGILA